MRSRSLIVVTLLTFVACAGPPTGGKDFGWIQEGRTTKAEIQQTYGAPAQVRESSTGSTWLYGTSRLAETQSQNACRQGCNELDGIARTVCAGACPAARPASWSLSVNFDQRGVVKTYTGTR